MRPFFRGIVFATNAFFRRALMTQVLRDEDIQFPPTTDNFAPEKQPILKDFDFKAIVDDLTAGI